MSHSLFIVTARREDLARALAVAARFATDGKVGAGILAHVRLVPTENGSLEVGATDLDLSCRARCPASIEGARGITLPARQLSEIAKAAASDEITIKVQADSWAAIQAGGARWRVAGLPLDDYPVLPDVSSGDTVRFPVAALADLIPRVDTVIVGEDPRLYSGAAATFTADGISLDATDGHRVAHASAAASCALPPGKASVEALIPKRAVAELKAWIDGVEGDISLTVSENHLLFTADIGTITTKRVGAYFPAVQKVLANNLGAPSVSVPTEEFIGALRRVMLASERSEDRFRRFTIVGVAGGLELRAESTRLGEATEVVEIAGGESLCPIGLNGAYVLQMVASLRSERFALSYADSDSPVRFTAEGLAGVEHVGLVAPCRL